MSAFDLYVHEAARIVAAVNVTKPYKPRVLKTDAYHRMMRDARKKKLPNAQRDAKAKRTRDKWEQKNKVSLKRRSEFVRKQRKMRGLDKQSGYKVTHPTKRVMRAIEESLRDPLNIWLDPRLPTRRVTPTKYPGITIEWKQSGNSIGAVVVKDHLVIGFAAFDVQSSFDHAFFSPRDPKVVTPHATMHKDARGLGLIGSIYALALNAGISLVTNYHTRPAHKVWEALTRQYKTLYVFAEMKRGVLEVTASPEPFPARPTLLRKCHRVLLGRNVDLRSILAPETQATAQIKYI